MDSERTPERVLIVHSPVNAGMDRLPLAIPGAHIIEAHSFDSYQEALGRGDFDVVVIDYDLPGIQSGEVLAQLKVMDHEPDVLLLSRCIDAGTISKISQSQKRYIVRDELWLEAMSRAVRDMLRIRRLEAEMVLVRARLTESNRQLEEKNLRLDEFCATIAHDIRSPLAGLILKVEYILDRYGEGFDKKCAEMLGRSAESAQRLVGIVQAMYEFAKLGRKGTSFDPIQLAPLAREVLADIKGSAGRQVTLEVSNMPPVRGNIDLLRRVFLNLFSNSIKYGDKEWVIISVTSDGITNDGDERTLQISVRDNGPGICAKDAGSIFKMFTRGSASPVAMEGLGVGLAVVERIIELHRGRIELIQDGEPGCCFRISLPLAQVRAPENHR